MDNALFGGEDPCDLPLIGDCDCCGGHSEDLFDCGSEGDLCWFCRGDDPPEVEASHEVSDIPLTSEGGVPFFVTARFMASCDGDGDFWDAWKDEMKDRSMGIS